MERYNNSMDNTNIFHIVNDSSIHSSNIHRHNKSNKKMGEKRINIGSGNDLRVGMGWDNLDTHSTYGANIIADLNKLPLEIFSNRYDYVLCSHVLEDFVNPIPLIKEMIRITKPKGIIEIIVPNETITWDSIHHKRGFTITTFKFFVKDYIKSYEDAENRMEIVSLKYYSLRKEQLENMSWLGRINWFVSVRIANFLGCEIMTNTFIKYFFPLLNIRLILKKVGRNSKSISIKRLGEGEKK